MSALIFPAGHTYIRYEEDVDFPEAWLKNFNWQDRADYLEWVAHWKAALQTRIKAIRTAKAIRRNKDVEVRRRGAANAERQALRIDCSNLFLIRRIGKQKAGEQRAAQSRLAA